MDWVFGMEPIWATMIATGFTWLVTACGAALIFMLRYSESSLVNSFTGFGLGVMMAASIWSMLLPAIEESGSWQQPALGFALGGAFILLADYFLEKKLKKDQQGSHWSKLMILAVTLHNIPEGMALGLAFCEENGLGPWILAMGIGLQNFPEGAAVALPLIKVGYSREKSFFWGQASGFVEPVAGVAAVMMAHCLGQMLPLFLSFAAGSMMAVVVAELISEDTGEQRRLTILSLLAGFLVMMILDVALG